MIKVGDEVIIEGKKSKVTARWAMGAHVRFVLEDGREFLDLDALVDAKQITVVAKEESLPKKDVRRGWYDNPHDKSVVSED